jgi:hypothetical protein
MQQSGEFATTDLFQNFITHFQNFVNPTNLDFRTLYALNFDNDPRNIVYKEHGLQSLHPGGSRGA